MPDKEPRKGLVEKLDGDQLAVRLASVLQADAFMEHQFLRLSGA